VSINRGASFTNRARVQLTIVPADGATGVTISNDGGFVPSQDFQLEADGTYEWVLDSTRRAVTRSVYVRFTGPGVDSSPIDDDIVLDRQDPAVRLLKRNKAGTRLRVAASDHNRGSGVAGIQITPNRNRPGPIRKFQRVIDVSPDSPRQNVRVIDKAGNRSPWKRERRGNR
jgi:hypothetical protein